ncbi:hypothetical protein C1H76_4041 [Elsinoe australis]|uniref:Uncharacterized protein n=1 Tax=Elsinoe australis TaxID=40998 RepID=A0A4U7B6H9_9PEZI|nr:hypothetical protein C1H76_4041 [Elsinoe australis]
MKRQELESLGLAYNQVYASAAIYMDNEASSLPPLQGDPIVGETTGIPINVYGIGFGEDYQDVYRDW